MDPTAHRRYAIWLISLAVLFALGFGFYGRQFEPLTGDLTRIGWYSENQYGWTKPEARFFPPLAIEGWLGGQYDIIAVGDSFTVDEETHSSGYGWPHYLARDTGLRVATFDSGIDTLEMVLSSPAYLEHPPAIFIYEIVERSLIPSHRGTPRADCAATRPTPQPGIAMKPLAVEPQPVLRERERPLGDWPASYAMNYLLQRGLRALRGGETTSAVAMRLRRDGLFSSRDDRGLLVYGEDFNKMGWHEADWQGALCDLLALQDRVQANGKTAFLVMLVPDKLTVYTPYLTFRDFDGLSRLDLFARSPTLNLVPLADLMDPTRTVDLYLPNDTHWSAAAHAMAARRIRDTLLARGIVREPAANGTATSAD
jgi:hypothetical protein